MSRGRQHLIGSRIGVLPPLLSNSVSGENSISSLALGTITAQTSDGQQVVVCWDDGTSSTIIPLSNAHTHVYDSAACDVIHSDVMCDGCAEQPIVGLRWKCAECDNYDLCSTCYHRDVHDTSHQFKCILGPAVIVRIAGKSKLRISEYADPAALPSRSSSTKVKISADVQLWRNAKNAEATGVYVEHLPTLSAFVAEAQVRQEAIRMIRAELQRAGFGATPVDAKSHSLDNDADKRYSQITVSESSNAVSSTAGANPSRPSDDAVQQQTSVNQCTAMPFQLKLRLVTTIADRADQLRKQEIWATALDHYVCCTALTDQSDFNYDRRKLLWNRAKCEAQLGRLAAAYKHISEVVTTKWCGDDNVLTYLKAMRKLDKQVPEEPPMQNTYEFGQEDSIGVRDHLQEAADCIRRLHQLARSTNNFSDVQTEFDNMFCFLRRAVVLLWSNHFCAFLLSNVKGDLDFALRSFNWAEIDDIFKLYEITYPSVPVNIMRKGSSIHIRSRLPEKPLVITEQLNSILSKWTTKSSVDVMDNVIEDVLEFFAHDDVLQHVKSFHCDQVKKLLTVDNKTLCVPVADNWFKFVSILGEGACGTVYHARQWMEANDEAKLAVKVMHFNEREWRSSMHRLKNELEINARLTVVSAGKFLVPSFSVNTVPWCILNKTGEITFQYTMFLKMPLAEDNLANWIARRNTQLDNNATLQFQSEVRILQNVLDAIMHLHSQQPAIVHGDLHLGNVLLFREDGAIVAKVADFSNSRIGELVAASSQNANERSSSQFFSSYYSQSDEKRITAERDAFSIGKIMACLLILGDDSVFDFCELAANGQADLSCVPVYDSNTRILFDSMLQLLRCSSEAGKCFSDLADKIQQCLRSYDASAVEIKSPSVAKLAIPSFANIAVETSKLLLELSQQQVNLVNLLEMEIRKQEKYQGLILSIVLNDALSTYLDFSKRDVEAFLRKEITRNHDDDGDCRLVKVALQSDSQDDELELLMMDSYAQLIRVVYEPCSYMKLLLDGVDAATIPVLSAVEYALLFYQLSHR